MEQFLLALNNVIDLFNKCCLLRMSSIERLLIDCLYHNNRDDLRCTLIYPGFGLSLRQHGAAGELGSGDDDDDDDYDDDDDDDGDDDDCVAALPVDRLLSSPLSSQPPEEEDEKRPPPSPPMPPSPLSSSSSVSDEGRQRAMLLLQWPGLEMIIESYQQHCNGNRHSSGVIVIEDLYSAT